MREGRGLPRRVLKIRVHICETELKDDSQTRSHIFRTRVGTHRTLRPKDHEIEFLGPRFREIDVLFGLFRCAFAKFETTFLNQLSILFDKCGLMFSGRGSEDNLKISTTPTSQKPAIHHVSFVFFWRKRNHFSQILQCPFVLFAWIASWERRNPTPCPLLIEFSNLL